MTFYEPQLCPMPGCTEQLHVVWELSSSLYTDLDRAQPPDPTEAYSSSWRVECTGGHVVLLPGETGCGCDEPECAHNQDDYDWSEDSRTFTAHDVDRLQQLRTAMGGTQ